MGCYHAIGRIIGKTNDYKICSECGKINWYERDYCIACNSTNFKVFDGQEIVDKANNLKEGLKDDFDDVDNWGHEV